MEARLQRRIQRYGWDLAAGSYEESWRRQLEPAQATLLEMAAIRPGDRVVDVACGTGLVSIPAARACAPGGAVVGTDISQTMVDTAAERARAAGVDARFERMGAERLDLADGTLDVALCALGLMYVPEPGDALREMSRVLKPGGRAVAAVWGERRACGWAGIFPVVEARVNTEVCPLFFQLGTGRTLAARFERAGFMDIREDRLTVRLRYANELEALTAAFDGGPVALAESRFDDATRGDAHRAYLETIAAYRLPEGGYDMPGEYVIVSGVKPEA